MTQRAMCFSAGILLGVTAGSLILKLKNSKMDATSSVDSLKKTVIAKAMSVADKADDALKEKVSDLVSFIENLDWRKLKSLPQDSLTLLKEKLSAIKDFF